MRSPLLLASFVLVASSCKQSCGLDAVMEGAGGAGASAATTTSTGTTETGGGGEGPATGGGSTGTLMGTPCAADPQGVCVCEDEFESGGHAACWTEEQDGLVAPPTYADGALSLHPAVSTGFWDWDADSYFLYALAPPGPFAAVACVAPYDMNLSWPQGDYNLAGWVARAPGEGPSGTTQNWLKAEVGAIDSQMMTSEPTNGVRIARRDTAIPHFGFGDVEITATPTRNYAVAICRLSGDQLLGGAWAKDKTTGESIGTFDGGQPGNVGMVALGGPIQVGLVAAVGSQTSQIRPAFLRAFVSRRAVLTLGDCTQIVDDTLCPD